MRGAWTDPAWDMLIQEKNELYPILEHRYPLKEPWQSYSYNLLNIHVAGVFDADCRVSDKYWTVYFTPEDSIEIPLGNLVKGLIGELRGRGLW